MGAVSVVVNDRNVTGNKRVNSCAVTFSNNYATGGDTVTAANFGLTNITTVQFADQTTTNGYTVGFDDTNKKFKAYNNGAAHSHGLLFTGGQAGGVAAQITPDSAGAIVGKTTATNFTAAGGASNILTATPTTATEVTSTTDLSAESFDVVVIGT